MKQVARYVIVTFRTGLYFNTKLTVSGSLLGLGDRCIVTKAIGKTPITVRPGGSRLFRSFGNKN